MGKPIKGAWVACAIALALSVNGCGDDAEAAVECPVVVAEADCDTSLRPIVFVHGTFGSGDNIANVANLFGSNGYCQKRFVAVEYNSLGGDPLAQLDVLIDEILEETGQDQVDLMGHSQGTGHCITYLGDTAHAAKVAHYVNLSGGGTVPDGVHALSLSSNNDLMGVPHHSPGADEMVTFEDEDHVDVAASDAAFIEIYKYLIGRDPTYTTVQCDAEEIEIQGIAETFGDNVPVANGRIEVYELGDDAQERGEPVAVIEGDENGRADAITLKRLTEYEFKALDEDGTLVGHLYFGKLKRSHYLARFLAPPTGAVALLTTSKVVVGPNHAALVGRFMGGSFRRDMGQSLRINGEEVLSDDNAGRTLTTVGLFMADQNENGTTELGAAFSAPFVKGTDVFVDASEPAWIDIEWNGEPWRIPNWKSDEGLISIMFH